MVVRMKIKVFSYAKLQIQINNEIDHQGMSIVLAALLLDL